MFLWRPKSACCSSKTSNLKFYVGKELPNSGPFVLDSDKMAFCAHFPYGNPLGGFYGITCDYYTHGRYAIIATTIGHLYFIELAVFGIPAQNVEYFRELQKIK